MPPRHVRLRPGCQRTGGPRRPGGLCQGGGRLLSGAQAESGGGPLGSSALVSPLAGKGAPPSCGLGRDWPSRGVAEGGGTGDEAGGR